MILNYNDSGTTLQLLNQIKEYQSLDSIVVVDNHSTDDSVCQLQAVAGGHIHLLQAEKNGGYGSGNNLGIRYAREQLGASYVIVANPDVQFEESLVKEMKITIDHVPDCGLISARIFNPQGQELFSCWKLLPLALDLLDTGLITRRLFKPWLNYSPKIYRHKPFVQVDAVPGSFFMLAVNRLGETAVFDEHVFLYYEEKILGMKLKAKGKKILLLTQKRYIHAHSVTIDKSIKSITDKQRILHNSKQYYYKEYLKAGRTGLWIANLFLGIVMLEVRLLTEFFGMRW